MRLRGMCGCLPACLSVTRVVVVCVGGGGYSIYFYKLIRVPPSPGLVSVFVCLSVCQHWHPMSWSATNPLCLKCDLFRKTILTNLNMLSVDHVFCERSYLCDFNRESLQSREVVQTFNRTSLSDNAAYRVQGFGNPGKIQGRTQKYRVPAPQNAKQHA